MDPPRHSAAPKLTRATKGQALGYLVAYGPGLSRKTRRCIWSTWSIPAEPTLARRANAGASGPTAMKVASRRSSYSRAEGTAI